MSENGSRLSFQKFPRREHLKTQLEIETVFTKGTRHSIKFLRLYALRRSDTQKRVVFIPIRKYGISVIRHRVRRVVSEAYRLLKARISGGWDFVFVIYPDSDTYSSRFKQVESILQIAGAIN